MKAKQYRRISLRSDLLGMPDDRNAQYKWLKWLEKTGLLAAYLQAMYECNVTTRPVDEVIELSGGELRREDFATVCQRWRIKTPPDS